MKLPVITHEMRSRFKECPRRFYWPHVAGITDREDFLEEEFLMAFKDGINRIREGLYPAAAKDMASNILAKALQSYGVSTFVISKNQAAVRNCIERYQKAFKIDTESVIFPGLLRLGDESAIIHAVVPRHNGAMILIDRVVDEINFMEPDAYKLDEEINHLAGAITLLRLKHKERPLRPTHAVIRQVTLKPGNTLERKVPIDMQMVEHHWKLKTETNHVIRQMAENVHDIDSWPWNFGTCSKTTGQCPYVGLCSHSKNAQKEKFIHTLLEPLDNGQQRKQHPTISTNTFTNTPEE